MDRINNNVPPFDQVNEMVKNGYGIKEAILKIGYKTTSKFYKLLTNQQKAELKVNKLLHAKHPGKHLLHTNIDNYYRNNAENITNEEA
jgi:hypothetical protein